MFKQVKELDRSGTYFQCYVGVTGTQLEELFGTPAISAFDDDKGYKNEYLFSKENEPVRLYDRWGVWRIGSLNPETATSFKEWLLEKINTKKNS